MIARALGKRARGRHLVIIVGLVVSGPAAADPDADIGAFMKRSAYRASYEAMLAGRQDLPKWMATPSAIADSTTLKITNRILAGKSKSIFELCKPDACDMTGLIVIFSDGGDDAKGLLSDKDDVFLGKPDDAEKEVLVDIKNSDKPD